MHKEFIINILSEHGPSSSLIKRNLVKEYLQILVLAFIYASREYKNLVFYGGSCLRHCFELPRLSEDLDFVDLKGEINLLSLTNDLVNFLKKEGLECKAKAQKFRIYLKLPLLYDLDLAHRGESNFLYIKVEVFRNFNFCANFKTEIKPVFKFGKSILVKTFDLPTLMATKLGAILYRKWEKTDREGKTLIKVKGRDYFDLMWYLNKKVEPNLNCIENIRDAQDLKEKLLKIVHALDPQSIRLDLEGLIEDRTFVKNLSENLRDILLSEI